MTSKSGNQQAATNRYGRCVRRHIWLTRQAIGAIGAYARQQGGSFSAVLENLAMRGIENRGASATKADPRPSIALLTATYSDNIETILTIARSETMHDLLETREERYGKTVRKHISLTPEAVTVIEVYAAQHDISFSAAIETLALLGLGNRSAETLPRLLAGLVDSILRRYLDRCTLLSSQAVLAAEEANTKTDFLVLQTLWHEARQDPDGFEEKLGVSLNPDVQPDRRVRELQQQVKDLAQAAGIERLRQDAENTAGGEQEGMTDG